MSSPTGQPLTNWSGNVTYSTTSTVAPSTVDAVRQAIMGAERIKVQGTRHSFSTIADSTGTLLSLHALEVPPTLIDSGRRVRVSAGARFGDLCTYLAGHGLTLPNLASLPHISLAGAYATGTHGSGNANAILAASVSSVELVTGKGELRNVDRVSDGALFEACVVGLGALGVAVTFTLDVVPAFDMRQSVYEHLPFAALDGRFTEVMGSAYSVSLFTDWRQEAFTSVWCKSIAADHDPRHQLLTALGATAATQQLHPIPGLDAVHCTPQLGHAGAAAEHLPHFRMDFTPSNGDELQSEYLLPRQHAVEALAALLPLRQRLADLVQVSEVRTVAADSFWMSPCHGRDTVAFHFTWVNDWAKVRELLPLVEAAFAPFEPRPHWGKLFTMAPAAVAAQYPDLPRFVALAAQLDPAGRFRNEYLDRFTSSSG